MHVCVIIGAVLVMVTTTGEKTLIDWTIYGKVTNYGDTLTLFCEVDPCCKETAGWARWIKNKSDYTTLIFSVKDTPFSKAAKYNGRIGKSGFYLMIRNVSSEDFGQNYSCTYGLQTSPKKLLTKAEAFSDNITATGSAIKNKREDSMTSFLILVSIFIVIVFVPGLMLLLKKLITFQRNTSRQDADVQAEKDIHPFTDNMSTENKHSENVPLLNQSLCGTADLCSSSDLAVPEDYHNSTPDSSIPRRPSRQNSSESSPEPDIFDAVNGDINTALFRTLKISTEDVIKLVKSECSSVTFINANTKGIITMRFKSFGELVDTNKFLKENFRLNQDAIAVFSSQYSSPEENVTSQERPTPSTNNFCS